MPLRNVASTFTIEQQRLEINNLAGDVNNIATGVTNVGSATTASALAAGATGEDLTLSGTLTVNGTQTILNTATLEVEDKNIVIAKGATTDAAASGGGITLKGANDKTITYNQTGDQWESNKNFKAPELIGSFDAAQLTGVLPAIDGSALTGITSGATLADAGNANANRYVNFSANTSGTDQTLNTDGSLLYNAAEDALKINGLIITQGGINGYQNQLSLSCANHSSTCSVKVGSVITTKSNILPESDNTDNLGSTTKRWANVYTADLQMNNTGTGGNDVDGSEGHWTMQEGANDLFLINRLTGKKYKFNLTEVS